MRIEHPYKSRRFVFRLGRVREADLKNFTDTAEEISPNNAQTAAADDKAPLPDDQAPVANDQTTIAGNRTPLSHSHQRYVDLLRNRGDSDAQSDAAFACWAATVLVTAKSRGYLQSRD